MELYTSVDAPSVERSVLARLKRLDSGLNLTFSTYAIDPLTSVPMEVYPKDDWEAKSRCERRGGSWFLVDPAFHLWVYGNDGLWRLLKSYPAHEGFGHREVAALEQDVARFMKPSEIVSMILQRQQESLEKAKKANREMNRDRIVANQKRIWDLFDGKGIRRDGKAFSYSGQANRSTPSTVTKDLREDGWETWNKA